MFIVFFSNATARLEFWLWKEGRGFQPMTPDDDVFPRSRFGDLHQHSFLFPILSPEEIIYQPILTLRPAARNMKFELGGVVWFRHSEPLATF